jgi:hypothetical protein
MRRSTRLVVLALVAGLAASCASSTATEPPVAVAPAATEPAAGESAALVAPLLGGGTFDLSAELALAPVAMWFWAPG